jgi:hypothetical protein
VDKTNNFKNSFVFNGVRKFETGGCVLIVQHSLEKRQR